MKTMYSVPPPLLELLMAQGMLRFEDDLELESGGAEAGGAQRGQGLALQGPRQSGS